VLQDTEVGGREASDTWTTGGDRRNQEYLGSFGMEGGLLCLALMMSVKRLNPKGKPRTERICPSASTDLRKRGGFLGSENQHFGGKTNCPTIKRKTFQTYKCGQNIGSSLEAKSGPQMVISAEISAE